MDLGTLAAHGYAAYPRSIRPIEGGTVFVARRDGRKFLGIEGAPVRLDAAVFGPVEVGRGRTASLHELTWENYEALRALIPIAPVPCDRPASFGTGDRLGMVTAPHLDALAKMPVFPVTAQQSPRELTKTGRSFRSVLLDAAMGALEVGYQGPWGADADHIKDEQRLTEAVRAGYSMYTLDLSGFPSALSDESDLSELSRGIVKKRSGLQVGGRTASQYELTRAALAWQPAMESVERLYEIIRSEIASFDLEISIDEGAKETSLEEHLFTAEYLHGRGIDFTSLAPRFPGKFRKGIDFIGDIDALGASMEMHAALARIIGGYKLSLHSGSDKWRVYEAFRRRTEGHFHVKTSGTSWLQAVALISAAHQPLFHEMYRIALDNLSESARAYDTDISVSDFPADLAPETWLERRDPDLRQLFHISYAVLLAEKGDAIRAVLAESEELHYSLVGKHIERHLERLF